MKTKKLSDLIQLCGDNKLNYFEYTKGNKTIVFRKDTITNNDTVSLSGTPGNANTPLKTACESKDILTAETQSDTNALSVCSHLIGLATISEQLPYPAKGSRVGKGDVLCTICAMKVYTDVIAPVDGIIKEILFEDNDMVECGQELFRIQVTE